MAASTPSPLPRTNGGIRTGRVLQTTISVAILLATLFTGFSPRMFSTNFNSILSLLLTPPPPANVAVPTSQRVLRIGIVSGHWGNDSGSVCPNGVTEQQVNLKIASLVRQKLTAQGFQVDLLQEFDPRLNGYVAAALVSIHNDSCDYINEQATGFKVASAVASRDPNLSTRLVSCLRDRYGRVTSLPFHPGSITPDMTDYHAFREIDPATTAAIIETGFLNKDYIILTEHPDLVADGVVAGIMCFVNNENVAPAPTLTP
jgi:N-acetylmuramoyl-L-alanine amidase